MCKRFIYFGIFLVSHYNEYFESAMRFSVQENGAQKENPNGFLSQSYADI